MTSRIHSYQKQEAHLQAFEAGSSSEAFSCDKKIQQLFQDESVLIQLTEVEQRYLHKLAFQYPVSSNSPVIHIIQYHNSNILGEIQTSRPRLSSGNEETMNKILKELSKMHFLLHHGFYSLSHKRWLEKTDPRTDLESLSRFEILCPREAIIEKLFLTHDKLLLTAKNIHEKERKVINSCYAVKS